MSDSTPYTVPKEPGRWRALTLAVIMHAALFAMLWLGVRWQSQTPIAIEAEVWSPQPREAAPPEPEQKPEPVLKEIPKPPVIEQPVVQPDIALELEKKKKAAADKKKQAPSDKMLAKARAEEMRRITGAGGTGDAPKTQGGRADSDYRNRLSTKIFDNSTFIAPEGLIGNPAVEYTVELLPDGSVRSIKKLKSSGVPGFDEAIERAVRRSEPYPPDKSGRVPPNFTFSHKPKKNE